MKYTGYIFESVIYDEDKHDAYSSTTTKEFTSRKEAKQWLHAYVKDLGEKGYSCDVSKRAVELPVYHKDDDILECTVMKVPFYTRGKGDIGYLTDKPRKCHWY